MKSPQILRSIIFLLSVFLISCGDDDGNNSYSEAQVQIEITDAPVDNANISGVFVTVAKIKLDGQELNGFTGPKTINLYPLQNGNTEILGFGDLSPMDYSSLTLVLNTEQDQDGNTPGCYVELTDGTKDNLMTGRQANDEVVINQSLDFEARNQNVLVIDFDLRKTIRTDTKTNFEFYSGHDLSNGIRTIFKRDSGSISGKISGNTHEDSKLIVYAFESGKYSPPNETVGEIPFQGAITSSLVDENGNYTIPFLEHGEYEIVCADYKDIDGNGDFELQGTLGIDIMLGVDRTPAKVEAKTITNIDLNVIGLIPF